MKYFVTFLSGAFVGAIVALLFAPSSGEELRTQIREGVEVELKRAEAEWKRAQAELNVRLDETLQELRTLARQSEAPEGTDAEVETEPVA
jgi:gas vesicle protein